VSYPDPIPHFCRPPSPGPLDWSLVLKHDCLGKRYRSCSLSCSSGAFATELVALEDHVQCDLIGMRNRFGLHLRFGFRRSGLLRPSIESEVEPGGMEVKQQMRTAWTRCPSHGAIRETIEEFDLVDGRIPARASSSSQPKGSHRALALAPDPRRTARLGDSTIGSGPIEKKIAEPYRLPRVDLTTR
jgi:hypothetical protein